MYKYHGNGNDFIMIDNRSQYFKKATNTIAFLCNRHFGIGADGLILIETSDAYDFRMIYYNADGEEGTMCGNGGRCAVAFAHQLGIIKNNTSFIAIDGEHKAELLHSDDEVLIRLKMKDVNKIQHLSNDYFIDTGSPHHICFLDQRLDDLDIDNEGRKIRWSKQYQSIGGVNVNFVEEKPGHIYVRTFERGVEAETLSCGTGVTAASLAFADKYQLKKSQINIETKGGKFTLTFEKRDHIYQDIYLCGPAKKVFKIIINI